MDWQTIKEKIYYWNGSWRDIYVLNTVQEDWRKWIRLVNENYPVEFYNGQTDKKESLIHSDVALGYLEGKIDFLVDATIKIKDVLVKCYFFVDQEIENDIEPREVRSIDDHHRLVDYMVAVSKCLDKPVILTDENSQDVIHIMVDRGKVTLNLLTE